MRFARFFIDRPIFAGVLSLLIVIAGLLTVKSLPLTEYPSVMPPTVQVRAMYPGANPKTIAETVAAPLEQEINGMNGMQYMSSQATSDGRMTLTVTFAQGTDPEMAQVEVQNRVSRAVPRLPLEVQRIGVVTQKTSPDMLMVIHLTATDDRYDLVHVHNYATLQLEDELAKLDGVDEVVVWGAGDYSLRVWLDPDKTAARGMTATDVLRALREQNVQVAAGVLGQPTGSSSDAPFQVAVNAQGRLSPDEFGDVILETGERGEIVRLRDVARIELGANQYSLRSLLNNKPAVGIQIFQSADASAIAVSDAVRATLAAHQYPDGIQYKIAYDPTIFVRASIGNVIETLVEAIVLVVIVVLLFLQSWRASVIPVAAVPVSLIGTFAVMHQLGFSLNTLSLFGLVLSIGIVVDDAIVVVENVERHLSRGKSPRDAAVAAMQEVTGPIIAITSVLAAVFIPTAFLSGLTGQFYRQFALTIAISTVLSAINSLTLSPALAAVLLKQHAAKPNRFFAAFNRFFDWSSGKYVIGVGGVLRKAAIAMALFAGLIAFTVLGFRKTPSGFVPAQDKYYLVGIAQLPSGASLDRTESVLRRMTDAALKQEGVQDVVGFAGLSINGFATVPNAAVMFVMLDPFEERTTDALSANAIAGALNQKFQSIDEGFVAVFPPPPVPGLGAVGGFKMQVQDRSGQGYAALLDVTQKLIAAAAQDKRVAGLFSSYQVDVPQVYVDFDRAKAKMQGVALGDLYETLQVYLGSVYVNDFNFLGRTYQVNLQADAPFRQDVHAIGRLYTRNADGAMVPVGALANVRPDAGPDPVVRYNAYPAADITGAPAPSVSSGEAVAAMEELAAKHLPPGFTYEWTDLTYQQKKERNAGLLVFPIAVLLAFLILAAQYNSVSLPFAVMLVVPTVLLSALFGVWITGGDNNIFTQIGFIVLVGLATKNAILIVEFARTLEQQGRSAKDAVLEACRLRLRPILMTSLAFIIGVVPLVLAGGAGAEMRRAMGVAVFAGMLGVTLFGLFLTPLFYYLIRRGASAATPAVTRQLQAAAMFAVVLLTLTSCASVGPKYVAPAIDAAPSFAASGFSTEPVTETRWWTRFEDPALTQLVDAALRANPDLREAVTRVDAARAIRGEARQASLPTGGVAVAHAHQSIGRERSKVASAGIDIGWEIDLFGRIRNLKLGADAELGAAEALLSQTRVVVAAEVARTYVLLRASEERIALLERYRADQAEVVKIIETRVEEGVDDAADLARARTVLGEDMLALANEQHNARVLQNALAVLIGAAPGHWQAPAAQTPAQLSLRPIAVGDPAALLQRRPDVRAAERVLAAETADIGVATSALFPQLQAGGFFGLVAGTFGDLGAASGESWSIGPALSWGIFDLGRVRAQIQRERAEAEGALAAYERTVLRALEETENAFSAFAAAHESLGATDLQLRNARLAAELVEARYEEGMSSYFEFLDARRAAVRAELGRINSIAGHRTATVDVFRALGSDPAARAQ
jgi:gold/copper resistance efflux pump